jgi:hypothetical protein
MAIIVRALSSDVYLSHLPMFSMEKHRYQVILEASLIKKDTNKEGDLRPDQLTHKSLLYTLQPEPFSLPDLFQPDPTNPRLKEFDATVYRGHFERGGAPVIDGDGKPIINKVRCLVRRVIYARKFDPAAQELPQLEYLLFGDRQEQFLAHLITKPPDFDQLLEAKVNDPTLTDEELRSGITVVFPRPNTIESRLGKCQRLVGKRTDGKNPQSTVELQIETCEELYFETGDLSS